MQNIEGVLKGLTPVPVVVTSTAQKHGREDIRRFPAWVADEGEYTRYILVPTFHDLDHTHHFEVGVGCIVNDRKGEHICIECIPCQPKRKIHPSLLTKKVL